MLWSTTTPLSAAASELVLGAMESGNVTVEGPNGDEIQLEW
ncbi:MAG: hypothetical protein VX628_08210 [Cyanobacteriota bacterium]|nr:hypothetical protein [Cyanobacteriota bacterium]